MALRLQFQWRSHSYKISFRLGFFLLCSALFCLFCLLGVWQLHRYDFKKSLLETYHARLNGAPVPFATIKNSLESLQFQQVLMQGHYLNDQTMLVQNQFYKDQLGYNVLTPFQIEGDAKLILVDRGFIAKPQRKKKISVETVNGPQQISGYIKLLNEHAFILGKNILEKNKSPIVIQRIDTRELSQVTNHEFYPFVLRLNANMPHGYVRDWVITNASPERHMGYAVQWFLMALVLLIAYFCFCCERIESYADERSNP